MEPLKKALIKLKVAVEANPKTAINKTLKSYGLSNHHVIGAVLSKLGLVKRSVINQPYITYSQVNDALVTKVKTAITSYNMTCKKARTTVLVNKTKSETVIITEPIPTIKRKSSESPLKILKYSSVTFTDAEFIVGDKRCFATNLTVEDE